MSTSPPRSTAPLPASTDLLAVGCGPFNLGLAALASTVHDLDLVVCEEHDELSWHPGLMFDDALLQVSFLADLVTLVDPGHPLSFLHYLRDRGRLYRFYVRERFHPTRLEYQDYLRWAADRLPAVRFGHRVETVTWDGRSGRFAVDVRDTSGTTTTVLARDLVLGIGTEPSIPPALAGLPAERLVHSGDYLRRATAVDQAGRVTVVGSGQSGAEVTLDLLRRATEAPAVSWLTRTPVFAPLDYSKLVLEMTTPDYVRYFHGLDGAVRDTLVAEQWRHYKGISESTLEELHDALYRRQLRPGSADVELRAGVAVLGAEEDPSGGVVLTCHHADTGREFRHRTDLVVAATGYRHRPPSLLDPLTPAIRTDHADRPVVRLDHSVELAPHVTGRVFVSNADLHSHGVAAPDLGIGAVRNATILNAVTGRECYPPPRDTAFTRFAPPTLDGGA
ncbi:lysine 6-monooxygenase [Actinoalloteichus sp. AHMU CJ021]|uniref:lysine N(6)-hydroxylase/L-ornithine N(5)-oxygenase family protein n=1 Tax=Actinoalloteichus TaxID=65496 RepID=UPI000550BA76|nr:SidA/IucD/PvdA family monooxygenase [Actinoalloteichus caeruleus]AUS77589.1 lysine 6-monooxygenase [Actinoalloteichus sp. AHMU CJ021]